MLVKFRRRKLESQSASQICELLSDSVLTHCGVRDMCNMSSNYSGKDTHGLMTVHLACYSRNSSAKTVRGSTPRNSHPLMLRQAWNSSVVLRSCARAANFRYRGTQLWMTDNQAGRGRYADGSQRVPQNCRVASRTPKFGTAHRSRCQPHTC